MKIANIYVKEFIFSDKWALAWSAILTSRSVDKLNKKDRKYIDELIEHFSHQGAVKCEFQEIKD